MTSFTEVKSYFSYFFLYFIRTHNKNTERETALVGQRRDVPAIFDPKLEEAHAGSTERSIHHCTITGHHLCLDFEEQLEPVLYIFSVK